MPVTLSRVRSINLQVDNDSDGYADAADVIRTTLVITNTGTSNATNLLVNDPIGGTTFFGVVNISPLAFNDAFTAVGNTVLRVGGAANVGSGPSSQVVGNLLSNDIGAVSLSDGVPGLTLDAVSNLDTAHGTVNIFSNGSFNYISDAGYEGADSFSYTIHDAGLDGISGNADDLTSTATVAITVTGQVWYVDSAAAPGTGTGTSTNPFGSLISATAADSSGDYIYVKGSVTGTATLETGEHLIGTGASLDVAGFHLADAGSRSTVSGSSGFTVTLAGGGSTPNNEIAGINILSTGGAANGGITGTSFGQLSISNVTVDASGQALSLTTGSIIGTGLVSTDSDGGTNNVALTGVTGTLALGSGALSGATGSSFLVSGGTVTTTYSGNITQANNAALLDVQGGHATGTLTFSTATLSATNGTGLQFNNADGTYNLNGTNTMNGGDAGIDITNGSNGGFSFSANSSITNPTGIGFRVDGGNGNIDYNGTLSKTSDGRVIDVQNHAGGTISFDGTVSSTTSSDGVLLATNTGTTINFTNTLTINTSISNTTGFAATGGGTVSASGSGSSINSGQGTALNVSNTNIGAADMIFQSISSSGGTATGIILDTTGSAGGLHILGTGSAGSGGTIANKTGLDGSTTTGIGIYLNGTSEVFLDRMQLNGFGNYGIRGNNVTGFTLDHSVINGVNGSNDGSPFNEGSISFSNLLGSALITNSNISGGWADNIRVINTSGSLNRLTVSNSTIGGNSTTNGNDGMTVEAQGTSNVNVTVSNVIFTSARGDLFQFSASGSGTSDLIFTNNTLSNNHSAIATGGGGVSIGSGSTSVFTFNISDNTLRDAHGHAVLIVKDVGTGTMTGIFNNNTIGVIGIANSGSLEGAGLKLQHAGGGGKIDVDITNNHIHQYNNEGILLQAGAGLAQSGTFIIEVTGNTLSNPGSNVAIGSPFQGFSLNSGVTAGDSFVTYLTLGGDGAGMENVFTGSGRNGGVDYRIRARQNTDVHLTANNSSGVVPAAPNATYHYTGAATDAAAVATFLGQHNIGTQAHAAFDTGQFFGDSPPPPASLLAGSPPPADQGGTPPTKGDATGGDFVAPIPDPTPAPAPTPEPTPAPDSNHPIVVDDGVLSQAELNLIVEAAIQRWADAGATAEELTAMRLVAFTVENLAGLSLGSSEAGHIILDDNAAGFNWFIDTTPGEDSEYAVADYGLRALPGTVAAIRVDLLTTIMHELGHQIGLEDTYAGADAGELMYGYINPGQRRLPDAGDVAEATGAPVDGTDFALAPVGVGTLLPGQTVTIQWDATVDPHFNQVMPTFNNVSTITGSDGATPINVTSNSNTLSLAGPNTPNNIALDTLTLGGTIWLDNGAGGGTINNGVQDGTEPGITGVTLSLFADADNNNIADGAAIATFVTPAGGAYSFTGLAPGNYLVTVDAANFTGGGVLVNRVTAPGTADPDNNTDNDDNGIFGGGAVSSLSITLAQDTEPTADASGKFDINNTLDFGFTPLNQAPVNSVPGTQTINEDASRVFNGAGGNLISISDADAGAAEMKVTLSVTHGTLTLNGTVGLTFDAGDGTGDATMTFRGTQAAINTALNGLSYTPTGDFNGSDTLTVTTNDQGNTGADPGNTGDATSEQDSDTVTINITAINDAPTVSGDGTEDATTIPEDTAGAGQTINSLFSGQYSDAADNQIPNGGASSPGQFSGIAVTANGSTAGTGQWQYFSGGVWTNIGVVSDAAAKLLGDPFVTLIRFNPALNFNGPAPTLTVHLIDNSLGFGIVNGQVVDLSGGGATGGTTAYSTGTVVLSQTVTAVNDAPVNTVPGTQTINEDATITFSGGIPISVNDPDVGGGDLTVTLSMLNGQLTLNGIVGLTFTAGDGLDDTTMTFSGTQAAINTALNGLLYETTINFNGSDTLTITTNDQGNSGADPGGDPASEQDVDTVTINITPVNDAPTVSGDGTEDAAPIFQDNPTGGESVSSLFSGQYSDALDDQVAGGGISSAGPFTGIAVVVNGSAPATGQWQYLNGAVWTDMGAVSTASALLIGQATMIRFNPAAGFTGAAPTLTVHLIDDSGAAITMGQHVDISGGAATGGTTRYSTGTVVLSEQVNAPGAVPVIDLDGGAPPIDNTALYTEQAAPTVLASTLTISDADDTNLEGATVQITSGLSIPFDYLTVNGATNGVLMGITFNYSGATGILTLTGTAPLADYEAVLRQVGFESTSDSPGTSRQISWRVNDGSVNSAAAVTTVTVTPVNDAPVLDLNGAGGGTSAILNYTENAAVTPIAPAATVTDDSTDYNNAHLIITMTNGINAEDVLSIINQGTGAGQIGYSSGTITYEGVMIGTLLPSPMAPFPVLDIQFGAAAVSQAAAQALLHAIGYNNSSDNPTVSPARNVTFQLNDGDGNANGGAFLDTATATINLTAVNDAAIITGTVTGDVTEAGGIDNGTAGTPTATADLGAADPDNTNDAWNATVSPQDSVNGYGTYTVTAAGVWTYTLDDNDPAVQALLGAATLTDTFVMTTQDGTPQTVTITIHAQDDAPTARPDAVTTPETTAFVGNVLNNNGSGADSDPDSGGAITVSAVNGSGAAVGNMITLGTGAQLTVNANGTFTYNPNNAFNTTPTASSGAVNTPAPDSFTYTLTGGGTATVSITVTGVDSNDVLLGTAGADMLQAGIGNDHLNGLGGADNMSGNTGDDTYIVDNAGDVVNELGGQGRDVVYAAVSYQLAAGSEVEVLSTLSQSGTAAIQLIGNALGQEIYGNAGANFLEGGGGTDYLIGLGGNDTYVVDSMDDVIVEAIGGGTDTVYARNSYTLSAGAEVETLSTISQDGTTPLSLIGNAFGQTIYGNAGANFIDGGGGTDLLVGLGGNDTYIVDSASDYVAEDVGAGRDVVYAQASYALGNNEEIEVLSTASQAAATAIDLTGNEFVNEIYGNAGANVLNGRAGSDYLLGLGGADTFAFTSALGSDNIDHIGDFLAVDDTIALDDAVFTGLALGALNANAFVLGTAAGDADDRIIYDQISGQLWFDADGNGIGAKVLFAVLDSHPVITAGDFTVI
jgi:VCBS repeat-containing protein